MSACVHVPVLQQCALPLLQVQGLEHKAAEFQQQAQSAQAHFHNLTLVNQQLTERLEEASHGTAKLNDIIRGLETRHEQVVAAKGLAEDEASRLRQLLDESLASGAGPMSQHILRGYERRLAAAHQHLVKQVICVCVSACACMCMLVCMRAYQHAMVNA